MAKKKTTKKKITKKKTPGAVKTSRSGRAAPASGGKKKTTSKKSSSKKVAKKVVKKVTKKTPASSAKKKITKKKVSTASKKKPVKKAAKKTTTKKTAKKATTKKPTSKKTTKKKVVKKAATKKTSKKKSTPPKPAAKTGTKTAPAAAASAPGKGDATPANAANADAKRSDNRRRRSPKSKKPALVMPTRPLLLGPNGPALKPLIPSGTRVQSQQSVLDNVTSRRKKTPLTKAQLDHYRAILLAKRAELLGDMRNLEDEALRGDSGRSNASSQHLAEQGSDSYEQSLNLNLAASDRDRINEIDAALTRIADRTYGLCEMTFEPIKRARLDEIPWARYTIEAAREIDRRGGKR